MEHNDGMVQSGKELIHISHFLCAIGDNGCGPLTWKQLVDDIKVAAVEANKTCDTKVLSYASLYDILVFPSGSFSIIPAQFLKTYEFAATARQDFSPKGSKNE